ncbi:hypothetical protein Bca4012_097550 [Brassica carinata]|uniref:Uncharacterized protein n=1 Tax=Brassica carinata TaxID=52824 RepID=A0A8X7PDY0_BRACI|nr:hypothetical protein Bca52824_080317 [Brassica carinata]
MFNLVRSGGNGVFGSRSGGPVTIGVRVCRWDRLCWWSGFFFLAEAPSDDSTVPWWRRGYGSDQLRLCFSACLDHWWLLSVFPGSRVLTLRVMARGVQKRLQSQWFFIVSPPVCCCKFSVVGTREVVFSWCCRPSSELPVAARGEFLRLHPRLIGELRLPESSSGLWQRVGLSLSRNKGVIFGSVVSAKEGLSEAVGLSTVLQSLGRLSLRELAATEISVHSHLLFGPSTLR